MGFVPCLVRSAGAAEREQVHLGHPLLDAFLEFIAGRARWNTVLATAFDLKVFFSIIDTDLAKWQQRAAVLRAAYATHPERFPRGVPVPPPLPTVAWINKPPAPPALAVPEGAGA